MIRVEEDDDAFGECVIELCDRIMLDTGMLHSLYSRDISRTRQWTAMGFGNINYDAGGLTHGLYKATPAQVSSFRHYRFRHPAMLRVYGMEAVQKERKVRLLAEGVPHGM